MNRQLTKYCHKLYLSVLKVNKVKQYRFLYFKIIFILLIILFIIAHTTYFIMSEQNIYYWDYSGYWRFWEDMSTRFAHQPFQAFKFSLNSISNNDYNVLPIILPTIFSILPLPSRLSYILSISVFYYIPVIFLFSYIFCHFVVDNKKLVSSWVISIILPATFVAFWTPILAGYPDICGLLFILLAILYQFKFDIGNKIQIKKMLILGILLWAPFVLRRWYAYTVVSLYISLPILNYLWFFDKSRIWLKFRTVFISFFISGTTSCILAVIFQRGLIHRIINTNYSDIYAAYQGGMSYSIVSLFNSCGYYILPLVALGVVISLFVKDKKQKIFIFFCLFNLLFTFFLFTRTQSPGMQHNLPFALWMLFIACYSIVWLNNRISKSIFSVFFIGCLICFLGYIDQNSLFNRKPYTALQEKMFPSKHLPLRVDNYSAYVQLEKDIEKLVGDSQTVSILSSNHVLNDEMLNTISNQKLSNHIVYTSQVDLRDQIRVNPFLSNYMIIVDPPQTHLGESNQRVITIPVNNLLQHHNVGKAYIAVGHSYKLDDNATAWIYKKERAFTPVEVNEFLAQYYQYYPQWKSIYNKGLYLSFLTAHITKGDIYGGASLDSDTGIISTHPGENTPTIIEWTLQNVPKLKIQSTNMECNQQDTIKISISGAGAPSKEIDLPHGGEVNIDMMPWQNILSKIVIEKNKSSGCDALIISAL
ncbi:unnamed protein product [Commensalibacter communis]|uniref:Uncharacterized protein n=1 Tax=Commensalibacter communis TaxID=2972786 RepID=A0A9W4TMD0_9PROT|nr:unnamed protein product [Commensalibacter communis]CAI3930724.1 unnamed protein product [Commensalibacter communis]CAI3931751.1 unnamed protein product [Commensalibacter communis]CAI3932284.1 unnamed protein product [Commensalibacter communis]